MGPTAVLPMLEPSPCRGSGRAGSWFHETYIYSPKHARLRAAAGCRSLEDPKAPTCGPRPKEARKARMSW